MRVGRHAIFLIPYTYVYYDSGGGIPVAIGCFLIFVFSSERCTLCLAPIRKSAYSTIKMTEKVTNYSLSYYILHVCFFLFQVLRVWCEFLWYILRLYSEIVPKEITSSANDPNIGKFLKSAIGNNKNIEDLSSGSIITSRANRDRDIESLNMPFISTADNSFWLNRWKFWKSFEVFICGSTEILEALLTFFIFFIRVIRLEN